MIRRWLTRCRTRQSSRSPGWHPFSLRSLEQGERVVDAGAGGGFDSFVAAHQVGPQGKVIGVDMLPEMLEKARKTAEIMGSKTSSFARDFWKRYR